MSTERLIIFAIIIVFFAIIVMTRVRRSRLRAETAMDEWSRTDRLTTYEDEAYTRKVHAWAEEARNGELYDTRSLAELGSSPCPACRGDHPGTCDELDASEHALTVSDVITGTIVAVEDLPEPAPQTETLFIRHPETDERVSGLMVLMDEIENSWHRLGDGPWEAPGYIRDLPEDDWLRQLLTEELAAA